MSALRLTYLALAIAGATVPMYWFVVWLAAKGWSLAAMLDAWHANAATTGLVWDLTIAAAALTVWIVAEAVARRDWLLLVSVPATFGVGVSLGLPLHLLLRSRAGA
jgi:hypothetical protein